MTKKTRAVIYMLIAGFSFALMVAMVKLAGDLPAIEKMLFRNIGSMIILSFFIRKRKIPYFGKRENQKRLFGRAFFGTLAMTLFFYSVSNMYLADASMLMKLNPFFITLIAGLFLKEKISKVQIPALVIAFIASLFIIKPRFDLEILPALGATGAALFSGAAHVVVRSLKDKEDPFTIVFYFAAVSALLILPFTIPVFVMPTVEQWIYLALISVFAATGQIFLTNAYKNEKASEISIYSYVNILYAVILGYLIWGEVSDVLTITGGFLIIMVSLFTYFYNKKMGLSYSRSRTDS